MYIYYQKYKGLVNRKTVNNKKYRYKNEFLRILIYN